MRVVVLVVISLKIASCSYCQVEKSHFQMATYLTMKTDSAVRLLPGQFEKIKKIYKNYLSFLFALQSRIPHNKRQAIFIKERRIAIEARHYRKIKQALNAQQRKVFRKWFKQLNSLLLVRR